MTGIEDRFAVERWGDEGRSEVQALRNPDSDEYEVRVGRYDSDGS